MIFNKNHETLITTLKMKVTVIERVEDDDDLSFCFPKLKPFLLSFFSFWFVCDFGQRFYETEARDGGREINNKAKEREKKKKQEVKEKEEGE